MNKELLEDFVKYCKDNPEQRFWQALRNWACVGFIYVSKERIEPAEDNMQIYDTFYWNEKNERN